MSLDRNKDPADYSNIDWSLTNSEIGKLLDRDPSSVWAMRKRLGILPAAKPGQPVNRYLGTKRKPKTDDLDYEFAWKDHRKRKASSAWKRALLLVQGTACKVCGYDYPEISNHCHHILPTSQGGKNTLRNGIVLCSRCHDEVHAGLINLEVYTKSQCQI